MSCRQFLFIFSPIAVAEEREATVAAVVEAGETAVAQS